MTATELRDALRGVATGLLTPFDETGAVDHAALRANASELTDRGAETFLAAANISEYHSLSHEERVAVTETAIDALPATATVLAGVGGSTRAATALVDAYDDAGADAMMVMPPDHTFRHERGLLTYYREVGSVTETPLVPYVRGFEPSSSFLADLSALPSVAGIKYAVDDAATLEAAVAAGDDDAVWVDGLAEPHAPAFFRAGAEGFTAGVSNVEPRLGQALYDALVAGDWDRAWRLRDASLPFMDFRSGTGEDNVLPGANSVPAVKYGLELAGMHGGAVREPLAGLSERGRRRVEVLYEDLQATLDRLL